MLRERDRHNTIYKNEQKTYIPKGNLHSRSSTTIHEKRGIPNVKELSCHRDGSKRGVRSRDPERSPAVVNTAQFAFHYSALGAQSRGTRAALSTRAAALGDVSDAVIASRVSFIAPRSLCADNFSAIEQLRRHAINNAAPRDKAVARVYVIEPGPGE